MTDFLNEALCRIKKLEREVERLKTLERSGGVTDHGNLTGLGDDDHSQYLNTTRHDTTTRHTIGTVVPHDDHGSLSGLGDNDHPQYKLDSNPFVRVDTTSSVSIPNATFTYVEFDREISDTHGMWVSTDPGVITIPKTGVYIIDTRVFWTGNSNGARQMQMTVNGSATRIWTAVPPNGAVIARFVTSFIYLLSSADECEFRVQQNSGSALDLITLDVSFCRIVSGS